MFRRKKAKCGLCPRKISDDPAKVVLGDYTVEICEECERLLNVLSDKIEQQTKSKLESE